jgi:hypothetical protein
MTVWIYDQGEDLKVFAQKYGHAHNARHIRLAGSRDDRYRRLRLSRLQ